MDELLMEGKTIQKYLTRHKPPVTDDVCLAIRFAMLMSVGKVHVAMRLLFDNGTGCPMNLTDIIKTPEGLDKMVRQLLKDEHLNSHPACAC